MFRLLSCLLVLSFASSAFAYEGGSFAKPASQPAPKVPVLTKPPSVREFVPAVYPESEKSTGNVEVILLLYLDAEGNVTKAFAPNPGATKTAFIDAAIAAGLKLKFNPAEVDNQPSAIQLEFKYVFTDDLPASLPASAEAAASQPVKKSTYGTSVLKGDVREAGTRLRLEGVALRLQLADVDLDAVTDEKGRFEFRDLPPGEATLTVQSLLHLKRVVKYKLEANVETSEKNIYLQRERLDPYETIVQGKRDVREVTKRVISREELIKVPGSFGDPLRAIQNMPSVARPPLLGGNLVIRGSAPNSSEFYIDGMKLPALYHFGQGPSVIQESFIEDIGFFPCCFSPRYGRATAGIIEVTTRKPDIRKWSGKASADFGIARLFTEIPITENTAIQVGGRRSYYDAILPPILSLANPPLPGQIQNPILAPVFWDYQGRVLHHTKTMGDFTLFIFGSDDRLKFIQTPSQQTSAFNPAQLNITLTNHTIQPQWVFKITPNLTNVLTFQGNYELNTANTPDVYFELGEWNLGYREELRFKANDSFNFIFGSDGNFAWGNLKTRLPLLPRFPTFPAPGTESPPFTDYNTRQFTGEIGWYAESDIRLGKLRLLPGFRLEQITYVDRARSALTPRMSARYKLLDSLEIKASVGVFSKRPQAIDVIQDFGNPDLELESALHSTIGVNWDITQALSLETSVFANYLWNETAGTSRFNIRNEKIVPVVNDNRQVGRVFGAELMLRHKPYKNFFGWIAYTLSRSERRTDGDWFLFNFDQTHIFIVVASYILPYGIQVGARFRVISGNPTTPVAGSVYDADTGSYRRVNGAFRSGRLPAFHQLDLRIDKTFDLPLFSITVYIDVQNVYNQGNAEFSQFSYDFTRQQYFTGLPILPILGVEGKW